MPESKKKKHRNEAELALRREETARKRKNLTEKKLADEKVRSSVRLENKVELIARIDGNDQ